MIGTATSNVSTSGGAVTVTGPATTPGAGESATVTATTTPARDLTFEVYRRTGATTYTRVLQKVTAGSLTYSSPIAASDVVVACAEKTCGDPGNLKPGAGSTSIDWTYKPGADGFAELWDGESLAGWTSVGTGTIARNFMTSLATAGGATSANPGALYYSPRQFKDFELSVDYRTAATNNNGGVFLRFPAPATVGDIDRGGYQVAILDNGAATTRTGAITQERGPVTSFAAPTAPSTLYKPTREWNTLTIRAVRSHIQVWINGVLTATYDQATRNGRAGYIGLENAGNNLMYRSVRVKELAPDTVAPTITVDVPTTLPLGAAVPLSFSCADESELESCVAKLDGQPSSNGATAQRRARPAHAGRDRDRRRGPRDDPDDRVRRRRAGHRRARRHRPRHARADARRAAELRRLHPGRAEDLHGPDHGDDHEHRGRRDAQRLRPRHRRADAPAQRRLLAGAAADHEPAEDVGGPGLQRRHDGHVQPGDRRQRAAADRRLREDADLHAVHDHPRRRGALRRLD